MNVIGKTPSTLQDTIVSSGLIKAPRVNTLQKYGNWIE